MPYILRRRPLVQELVFRGAEMEAQIDDGSQGTNTEMACIPSYKRFSLPVTNTICASIATNVGCCPTQQGYATATGIGYKPPLHHTCL